MPGEAIYSQNHRSPQDARNGRRYIHTRKYKQKHIRTRNKGQIRPKASRAAKTKHKRDECIIDFCLNIQCRTMHILRLYIRRNQTYIQSSGIHTASSSNRYKYHLNSLLVSVSFRALLIPKISRSPGNFDPGEHPEVVFMGQNLTIYTSKYVRHPCKFTYYNIFFHSSAKSNPA